MAKCIGFLIRKEVHNKSNSLNHKSFFSFQWTQYVNPINLIFMKTKFFTFLAAILALFVISTNVNATTYIATTNGAWATPATWGLGSGSPVTGDDVTIPSGVTVTLGAAAACNNLTVQLGGQLSLSSTAAGAGTAYALVMDNAGLLTVAGTLYINGQLTTSGNVNISGTVKGTSTAGGTVQTWISQGTSPTITVTGTLGTSSAGATGESIRFYLNATGTTTITGGGTIGIARIQAASASPGTGANQTFVIDNNIELRSNNTVTGQAAFNLTPTAFGSYTKTLTINANKTVKLYYPSTSFGGYQSLSLIPWNSVQGGNVTINVNGILDCSAGQFNLVTTTSGSSTTQNFTINVGSTGSLLLGSTVRMYRPQSGQSINVNVASGGVVDGSSTAMTFFNTGSSALTGVSTNTSVPTTAATATIATAATCIYAVNGGLGGTGYTDGATVTVTGGAGSGAIIKLICNSAGTIIGYDIADGGTGYTSAPTITLPSGTGATAPTVSVTNATTYVIRTITLTAGGVGYVQNGFVTVNGSYNNSQYFPCIIAKVAGGVVTGFYKLHGGNAGTAPTTATIIGGGAPTQWFTTTGTGIVKQNIAASTSTPLWVGTSNTSYDNITITPDGSSAGVYTVSASPSIASPTANSRSWTVASSVSGTAAVSLTPSVYPNTSNPVIGVYNGSSWSEQTAGLSTATFSTTSNVSFSANVSKILATGSSGFTSSGTNTAGAYTAAYSANYSSASTWTTDAMGIVAASSAPDNTSDVVIPSGMNVTVDVASNAKTLTVNGTGTFLGTSSLTTVGDVTINGTAFSNAGQIIVGGNLTVNSGAVWTLPTSNQLLTTKGDVTIAGTLKGATTAGGSVATWYLQGSNPTITINGTLGGASVGASGESIRIYLDHYVGSGGTSTATFTGTGTVNIARLHTYGGNALNQTNTIDINMNINNTNATTYGLSLQQANNGTATKVLNINAGKTVTLTQSNTTFHHYTTSTPGLNNTGGSMTYNIYGILNISAGQFNLYSNQQTSTNAVIVNVKNGGVLTLGPTAAVYTYISGQTAGINAESGSTVNLNGGTASVVASTTGTGTIQDFITGSGDVNINNTADVTLNANATANNLTLNNALTVGSGNTLTIKGTTTGSSSVTSSGTLAYAGTSAQTISNLASNTTAGNITVNNTAGVSLGAAISVGGTLTVNSGSIFKNGGYTFTNSGTANINGSFQIDQGGWATGNGFVYGAAGTLIFNNTSGSYGVNSDAFWPTSNGPVNVTVLGAGGLTMNVARTITGVFQTAASVTNANNLTLNGTAQINSGGYFNNAPTLGSSSTLKYNMNGTFGRAFEWNNPANVQLSNNTTLNYPNTGNSGADAFSTNLSISGNLTVDAGSSLYMDYGGSSNKSGSLTVAGNLTLNGNLSLGNAVGGDLNVGGNWLRAASGSTFSPNSRAVIFNGTGAQTISNTGGETFNYLNVNKSTGSLTANNNVTVNNDLTLSSGDITTGANTLTLKGATSGSGAIVTSTTGTVAYSGTSAQTVSNLASNSVNCLTINNTAGASLNTNTIATSLNIGSGGVLNVNAAKQLTVNTTLSNSGTLNLLSASDGTATIITPATIGGTGGIVSVQQYLPDARNWYVSSPVSNALATSGYTYYRYNEGAANWTSSPVVVGNQLIKGVGYIALPGSSASTLTFTTQSGGTLNTGNVDITLSRSGATKTGFNLIGNPYPAHLTWNKTFVDSLSTFIDPTIWYRTNAGAVNNSGLWSFKTYNANTGEASPLGTTNIIPPMQAFWVRALQAGTLTLNGRLVKSHQSSNPLKAPGVVNADRQRVRLQVSNGTATDEALVYFDADAANAYDNYDSPKMSNNIAAIPEIYTQVNGQKLVINGMNSISDNMEIPLGFTTGQSNTFTIKATQLSNIGTDTKVYLKDNIQVNPLTELVLDQDYTFTSDITTDNTSRFSLLFKAPSVTTETDLVKNQLVRVYGNENNQIVIERNVQSYNGVAYIYNAVGQLMQQLQINSTITTSGVSYPCGTYFVTIRGNNKQTTSKLLINKI